MTIMTPNGTVTILSENDLWELSDKYIGEEFADAVKEFIEDKVWDAQCDCADIQSELDDAQDTIDELQDSISRIQEILTAIDNNFDKATVAETKESLEELLQNIEIGDI